MLSACPGLLWRGSRRYPTLRAAAFVGLVLGETSLLGVWGGLGLNPWRQRLAGVLVGIVYLFTLLGLGISELHEPTLIVVAAASLSVTMVLLIARFFRVAIHRDTLLAASADRIQFSVRHLMILTLVIACLITVGKWVQAFITFDYILFRLLRCDREGCTSPGWNSRSTGFTSAGQGWINDLSQGLVNAVANVFGSG